MGLEALVPNLSSRIPSGVCEEVGLSLSVKRAAWLAFTLTGGPGEAYLVHLTPACFFSPHYLLALLRPSTVDSTSPGQRPAPHRRKGHDFRCNYK